MKLYVDSYKILHVDERVYDADTSLVFINESPTKFDIIIAGGYTILGHKQNLEEFLVVDALDTPYVNTTAIYEAIKSVFELIDPTKDFLVAADIAGKEDKSNKVTSLGSGSSDVQYPSAKIIYDELLTKVDKINGKGLSEADVSTTDHEAIIHTNRTALDEVIGINTGDETQTTIKSKLGEATSLADGYLSKEDHATFLAKQAAIGYTTENVVNKLTAFQSVPDNTHYPSEKLVADQLATKQPTGSYLVAGDIVGKEDSSNKVTSLSGASTDVQYGSAKLLYDQLALKQSRSLNVVSKSANYTLTATDDFVKVTAACTITLPTPTALGNRVFHIKHLAITGLEVIVNTQDTAKIDGEDSMTITSKYVTLSVVTDGTDYFII